jgi:ATP-dependent Clp protease ATP-binding subunit ClpC
MLLQVLEDGTLTDSMRRKVNFKNTVLIMTSNLGARQIGGKSQLGFGKSDEQSTYDKMKGTVIEEVRRTFNPEFLNRIDDLIVFRALGRKEMEQIVHILFEEVTKRVAEQGLNLAITPPAAALLVEKGFDPNLGARPLRRAIQRLVEDPLAMLVLEKKFKPGSHVRISRKGDELVFEEKATGDMNAEKVGRGA